MKLGRRGFLFGATALVSSSSAVARAIMPAPAPAIQMGKISTWTGVSFNAGKLTPLTLDKVMAARRLFDRHRVDDDRIFFAAPSQLADLLRPIADGEIVFDEWTEESDDEEDSNDL